MPFSGTYVDDRSTPWGVIISYYNAISRKEWLRAYDYWRDPANTMGSFDKFVAGYSDTGTVDLVFGQITSVDAEGNTYYTVPVVLVAFATNGVEANYSACYLVRYDPANDFLTPPFDPMGMQSGEAVNIPISTDYATALSAACDKDKDNIPFGIIPIGITGENLSIDNGNYLDNRSGPVETVSSLLNAINLKQHVRGYFYFQVPGTYPGNYSVWANGFSDTQTITATFGTVKQSGTAGSLFFEVPVAEVITSSSNSTQTLVGCYTLHLIEPANQGDPPFQPIGITAGTFTQVANGSDVSSQLATVCP